MMTATTYVDREARDQADEYRRDASKYYQRHRKAAKDAAHYYEMAARQARHARWLTSHPELWEDDSTPAGWESYARSLSGIADTILRSSFSYYSSSVHYRGLAARYGEMAARKELRMNANPDEHEHRHTIRLSIPRKLAGAVTEHNEYLRCSHPGCGHQVPWVPQHAASPEPGSVCDRFGQPCPAARQSSYPLHAVCADCGSMAHCADGTADWAHDGAEHGTCAWCQASIPVAWLEPINNGGSLACQNTRACLKRQWICAGEAVCAWCGAMVLTMSDGQVVSADDDCDETAAMCVPGHGHHTPVYPPRDAVGRCDELRSMVSAAGLTETVARIGSMRVALAMQVNGLKPPAPPEIEPCLVCGTPVESALLCPACAGHEQMCHWCGTSQPIASMEPFNSAGDLACSDAPACIARFHQRLQEQRAQRGTTTPEATP